MAGFLIKEPVFEIREAGGNETDMLVRNKELGAALAKKLGNATVVLMRGHGDAVVGQSVKHAVLHAIYAEFNARIQSDALKLGGNITFLNEAERQRSAPGMTQAWTGPGNCGSARRWRGNSADFTKTGPYGCCMRAARAVALRSRSKLSRVPLNLRPRSQGRSRR